LKDLIKKISKILLVLTVFAPLLFSGCQNELTDEGISYIASDTLGTLVLDSQVDSLNLTANGYIKYINTTSSYSMFVGKSGNYESKVLIKFKGIPANYDTSTVLSAVLKLRYNKKFYQDSTGVTSFNIYKILNTYDLTTVTYDKFNSSDIGSTVIGTYTGSLSDTSRFSVPLDAQTVKDWFKYSYDTNYANKNYGLALVANNSSTTIKGLYSANYSDSLLIPVVTVVFQNPSGRIDTVNINYSDFTTLHYVPQINAIPDRFIMQNGVAIRDIIRFDVSKLPGKVIINQATLELKIDYANSFITRGIDKRFIAFTVISDSNTIEGPQYTSGVNGNDTSSYINNITIALQKWNYSVNTNLGLQIQNVREYENLDRYVFYGPSYPDVTKRPRIKIRYSIRH